MDDRLYLHSLLEQTFPGLPIYYRPSNYTLKFPCIVYEQTSHQTTYANNSTYVIGTTFQVSILALLPGYEETKKMLTIPNAKHTNSFTQNDVVHDIYEIHVHTI